MMTIEEVILIIFTYFLGDRFFLTNYRRIQVFAEILFSFSFFFLNIVFNNLRLLNGCEFFLNVAVFYVISENIILKIYNNNIQKIKNINNFKVFIYISVILYIYSVNRL